MVQSYAPIQNETIFSVAAETSGLTPKEMRSTLLRHVPRELYNSVKSFHFDLLSKTKRWRRVFALQYAGYFETFLLNYLDLSPWPKTASHQGGKVFLFAMHCTEIGQKTDQLSKTRRSPQNREFWKRCFELAL